MHKKVLIYLPFNSDFYIGLYQQIKRGFENAGCDVEGGPSFLDAPTLISKIQAFKPDFVFEMNRVKSEIQGFPEEVPHVCWLVDYWERTASDIKGSDILYLFSHAWKKDHPNYQGKYVDVLHPGTDETLYTYNHKITPKPSTIFLGHIPKPWNNEELNRSIKLDNNKTIKFKDIIPIVHHFTQYPKDYLDGTIATKKYLLETLHCQDIYSEKDRVLHYDIYARLFREGRRLACVMKALNSDIDLKIYGGENWRLRVQFQKHYQRNLQTPQDINQAFSDMSYLLHDGNMPHFRTFDAMASGLLVIKPDVTGYGIKDEWKFLNFLEGVDIATYNLNSKTLSCKKALTSSRLKDVKMHISDTIRAAHTWTHRAEKILKDVERCL